MLMKSEDRSFEQLLQQLSLDQWRETSGFSRDIEAAQKIIWSNVSQDDRVRALNEWIALYQPCIFARYAARKGYLDYLIVSEDDLLDGKDRIYELMVSARNNWLRNAFRGIKIGFVLLVSSPTIAMAIPDDAVSMLAMNVCSLFLEREIDVDTPVLDQIYLPHPKDRSLALCWDTPLNFFSAHGDKRWWSDRRIPGGIGFSLNSVGHAVATGLLNASDGIQWAVQTISASDQCSMKAQSSYEASFHTDYCLPSIFFRSESKGLDRVPLVLTTQFGISARELSHGHSWDEPDERVDGRPRLVHRVSVPFVLEEEI
jgi:hypothetical protein